MILHVIDNVFVMINDPYESQTIAKYFGVWTMLFTTNFFGNYYFFDQTEFAKFQKGEQAVALQENSGVGANTTLFLQLGDKGKTLLQTYPHNTTIYFVAENTNLIAQDGEIERLSMSIEFLPAGWMIFIFVVIGLVITLICLVLLVALPLMLCIGLGRVLSKIGMTNMTSDIEAPQPLYDEE